MEYLKIIMNLLNKIYISNFTYVFLLLSLLAGYFEYMFILLFFILIHELGHLTVASFFNFEIDKIILYPFGGLTKFKGFVNTSIYKELTVALSGAIFQIILYLIIYNLYLKGYVYNNVFDKVKLIHYSLLSFNLLPIIPLDGSKILNLTLEKFLPYKLSNRVIIFISILVCTLILLLYRKVFYVILTLLLIKSIYFEIKIFAFKYNKFLLERYLYKFRFKKRVKINNTNNMYKEKKHLIKYKNKYISEEEYLSKLFD